uniref:Uncharacterized protein n=1 Tax=Amphiprion percula TaxID=161767 RepID=A0A3P8T9Q0_AMPPE
MQVMARIGSQCQDIQLIKQRGKVKVLDEEINSKIWTCDVEFDVHLASLTPAGPTHGEPSPLNSHPHRSDKNNGQLSLPNSLTASSQESKGYEFESETDTETIAKLRVTQQLEGAFALVFKSVHYPGGGSWRGSPLLIGVRSDHKLSTDHIPVLYRSSGKDKKSCNALPRMDQDTCLFPVDEKAVEYYFCI